MKSVNLFLTILSLFLLSCNSNKYGIFESNSDIGNTLIEGNVDYDASSHTYKITGSGSNMWGEKDAFHYVYTKASGNVSLSTKISWVGEGVNPHRKAGIIIRQNLNPGSVYADAVIHGDGLTSLQYRDEKNGQTSEIVASSMKAPEFIKLMRDGNYVFMEFSSDGEKFHSAGGGYRLKIEEPYYIGIGVCSHEDSVSETAIFSEVKFEKDDINEESEKMLESTLETINIESKNRKVIYTTQSHIEAPNWSADGSFFIFNSLGKLFRLAVNGGTPEQINTGKYINCNNDHGLSPDNKKIVISDHTSDDKLSRIYTLPVEGGTPKLVTKNGPSYWHGWSPDGQTLAYCAERNGQYDIYTIPVDGGKELQLTDTPGLDDGPDYSPDGKYIYFNSVRTGLMQIWKMDADGKNQIQLTNDGYNDWFAHPSPDGKWLVFVSYEPEVEGHPANKDVMLRLMPAEGGEIITLTKLFGGQGTINVPSWSPDSKNVAFVSYRLVEKQ